MPMPTLKFPQRIAQPLKRLWAAALVAVLLTAVGPAEAARLKDIAAVRGVRSNQLVGYGLVVGLNGTGDKQATRFTTQSLESMLARLGVAIDAADIRVKNVAAVMVTANLPPFARVGSTLDAVISSIGDSKSLEGGTLVMTPLFAADGTVYAIAQGPMSVGGFSAGGGGGSSVQKNHPTVGRLAGGVTIEKELGYEIDERSEFTVALARPDFTTATRTADAINHHFQSLVATPSDPGTIRVLVPGAHQKNVVRFMAELEAVEVDPDRVARVVLNERTGTVVMGDRVRIDTVAVSHGNLSVTISAQNDVSQPEPFSQGETREVTNEDVEAIEEASSLTVVSGPVTIRELVRGLNSMGVTPRDLISILQAIKASGALSAELEVI